MFAVLVRIGALDSSPARLAADYSILRMDCDARTRKGMLLYLDTQATVTPTPPPKISARFTHVENLMPNQL